MARKTKAKTVKRTTKTATKGKAGPVKAFNLKIPAPLAKKLEAKADADTKFKGSNPNRYAMSILKNCVTT